MSSYLHKIDPALVSRLAKTYQIDKRELTIKIQIIGSLYLACKEHAKKETTAKDINRQLAAMSKSASDLRWKISDAHPGLHSLIEYAYQDLDKLNDSLVEFENRIAIIDPKGWKKNSETVSRDGLICRLAEFWKQQTGKPATRSSKNGQFIAFMCECADILDIDSAPLPDRFIHLKKQKRLKIDF